MPTAAPLRDERGQILALRLAEPQHVALHDQGFPSDDHRQSRDEPPEARRIQPPTDRRQRLFGRGEARALG